MKYSVEECRKQQHPHNNRCRYTDGYKCEDCNRFFPKDSEEYIRTEAVSSYWMSLHNISVDYARKMNEVPSDIVDLRQKFWSLHHKNAYVTPMYEIESMIEQYQEILKKYSIQKQTSNTTLEL